MLGHCRLLITAAGAGQPALDAPARPPRRCAERRVIRVLHSQAGCGNPHLARLPGAPQARLRGPQKPGQEGTGGPQFPRPAFQARPPAKQFSVVRLSHGGKGRSSASILLAGRSRSNDCPAPGPLDRAHCLGRGSRVASLLRRRCRSSTRTHPARRRGHGGAHLVGLVGVAAKQTRHGQLQPTSRGLAAGMAGRSRSRGAGDASAARVVPVSRNRAVAAQAVCSPGSRSTSGERPRARRADGPDGTSCLRPQQTKSPRAGGVRRRGAAGATAGAWSWRAWGFDHAPGSQCRSRYQPGRFSPAPRQGGRLRTGVKPGGATLSCKVVRLDLESR